MGDQQDGAAVVNEKLFEQITSVGQLKIAYKAVKANGGAPGIDGISVEDYGEELEEELSKLSWPVQEKFIIYRVLS